MTGQRPVVSKPLRFAVVGVAVSLFAGIVVAVFLWRDDPLLRAERALARGDATAAVEALIEHLEDAPEDASARWRLGELLKASAPTSALEYLASIPPEAPEYPQALRSMAETYHAAGRYDEAADTWRLLAQREPGDASVQRAWAEALARAHRYAEAVQPARRAAELDPQDPGPLLLLAELYDELKQIDAMIEPLERAVALDPHNYVAHLNLAYAYAWSGRLSEARREAQWCRRENPKDYLPLRILATVARDEGDYETALGLVQQALRFAPDDIDARILEADLLLFRGSHEAAYRRLAALREKGRDDVRFLGALARAAVAAGKPDEAERIYAEIDRRFRKPAAPP